jgi:putative endonuclease
VHAGGMGQDARTGRYRIDRGNEAEELAARYLEAQGLLLLARNFRCRAGELDIVALDGPTLVIAEVRQRATTDFGGAAASVTSAKQRKVVTATQVFLQRAPRLRHLAVRFDVIAIHGLPAGSPEIDWIRGAFSAT